MLGNQKTNDRRYDNGASVHVYTTMIRALSIIVVIIHNFILSMSWRKVNSLPDMLVWQMTEAFGTFVQLFFVLSGYGLTISYLAKPLKWSIWARRRLVKIVVPYWIALILTFLVVKLSIYSSLEGGQQSFSWMTLAVYLAFLQNVIKTGSSLNLALWFMPAIIGLYLIFPLLMQALKRYGVYVLIVISLLIGNISVAICVSLGYPIDNLHASPLFFVDEFALGMVLALIAKEHTNLHQRMTRVDFLCLGVILYALSWAIVRYNLFGEGSGAYNDIFTAAGLWFALLVVCRWMKEATSARAGSILERISRNSYIMYLMHVPVIAYVIKPVMGDYFKTAVNAIWVIPCAAVCALLTYFMAQGALRVAKLVSVRV